MENIEDKEIRGITPKTVRWLFSGIGLIIIAVVGNFVGLKMSINNLGNKNLLQDLKIKTNDVSISIINTKLETLQAQINQNAIEIEKLKAELNNN